MPEAYDRCVRKVSQKKGIRNPHALCTAVNAGNVKEYRRKKKRARHDWMGTRTRSATLSM